ncbi:MAG TPA: response regulator, partial [Nitrosomonas sp.]|nr:response regulator [Nitrosomonas sp.]
MVNEEKLKILMVERSDEDAKRVLQALIQGGFQVDSLRVATDTALGDALATRNWDIILSDYDLPQLTAQHVLQAIREHNLDVPVIVVSSHAGEEAAAHIMASGAYDFMTKENLARLAPAIRRSLHEVENYQRFIST